MSCGRKRKGERVQEWSMKVRRGGVCKSEEVTEREEMNVGVALCGGREEVGVFKA